MPVAPGLYHLLGSKHREVPVARHVSLHPMRGVDAPDPLTWAKRASDLKPDAAMFHTHSTVVKEQRFHPGRTTCWKV
jgi:hypothetical protein